MPTPPSNAELARQLDTLESHIMGRLREMDMRFEQRFAAQEKAVEAALLSAGKAVDKAEDAANKRFESVNEFRAQLADQSATFLTRKEYDSSHDALVAKVDQGHADLAARLNLNTNRIEAIEGGLRAQARLQTLSVGALGVAIMLGGALLTIFRT